MKLNILTELKRGPWGGGNQFLKALREESLRTNTYSENIENADVVLFNSHHDPIKVLRLRKKLKKHIFVHRIDGPMSYRGDSGKKLDKKIFYLNSLVADGTVFQSEWSKGQTIKENLEFSINNRVIFNAPDPNIFYEQESEEILIKRKKIKLITSSWSSNPKKGSEFLQYLDDHLDFNKYSMSFAGNIDKSFQNISMLGRLDSSKLADQLRNHDIFIFASEIEACSNSLLEALHSGLPVVCRNSSSNPEILKDGGVLFTEKSEMLRQIDVIAKDFKGFKENIRVKKISEIYKDYNAFFSSLKIDNKKRKLNFRNELRYRLGLL